MFTSTLTWTALRSISFIDHVEVTKLNLTITLLFVPVAQTRQISISFFFFFGWVLDELNVMSVPPGVRGCWMN